MEGKKTFFFVTFLHRNRDLWEQHLDAHTAYLRQAVDQGVLRASGPVRIESDTNRRGALIFACTSREELITSIAQDPFFVHGVIDELVITPWDPVFGVFASESSGAV